ncbi:hypothetical protein HYPP_02123 [Hyphomicrobium sp. ghe19]|nr:hypothetical protein HYPP_02123 [Hyphomicrobium sp. ghe19]
MTTFEMYYLGICLAAFAGFGIALAYTSMSWEHWRSKASNAAGRSEYPAGHAKLAA